MHKKYRLSDRMYSLEPMQRCALNSCKGACCLYGVWVGLEEKQQILQNAELIRPFMLPENRDTDNWFQDRPEDDLNFETGKVIHTSVVTNRDHYGSTACIFFGDSSKCALQVAGEENGYHPWLFKPFYCVLHPLDLDEKGEITLDKTISLLAEPGSCMRPDNQMNSLLDIFADELRCLMGEEEFMRSKRG